MKSFALFFSSLFLIACSFDASGPGNTNTTNNSNNTNNNNASCGNGVRENGEACDGTPSLTCSSLGFSGGTLQCTLECTFDTSLCTNYCGACEIGVGSCLDNQVHQCIDDGSGCGTLVASQDCTETSQWCNINTAGPFCSENCTDQCEVDDKKCTTDLAELHVCQRISVNGTDYCNIWQTEDVCTTGTQCNPQSLECEEICLQECSNGESSCTEDGSNRLICTEITQGCFEWTESPCPTGTQCISSTSTSVCDCNICEPGTMQCSTNGLLVQTCVENEQSCAVWETVETCDISSMQLCHETPAIGCSFAGNTCTDSFNIQSLPFSVTISDFAASFTNQLSFTHESCGVSFGGATEMFLTLNLLQGQTIKIERTSGINIAIRVQKVCGETEPCSDYKNGNLLYFTAFESGEYTISIEKTSNGTGTGSGQGLSLTISSQSNSCNLIESEINNTIQTSDNIINYPVNWCHRLSPGDDLDCVGISLGNGESPVVETHDVFGGDNCTGGIELQLYDPYESLIFLESVYSQECTSFEPADSYDLLHLTPGDYTLCMSSGTTEVVIPSSLASIRKAQLTTEVNAPMTGSGQTCIPPGWDTGSSTGIENWKWFCDATGTFAHSYTNYPTDIGNTWLTTPPMNLSGKTRAILMFDMKSYIIGGPVAETTWASVYISTDNFNSSKELLIRPPNSVINWTPQYIDISAWAGNPDVRISFIFEDTSTLLTGSFDVRNVEVISY
ncbi:hypothetical protein KKF34_00880 [Myxococcota bacterium]|nr:hypothetical protein [Myxococcota bacterium]MBU1382200.1 hypothetical protein [Myxococcota bacterium]MBU1495415.1 hypothetical protein [Myxococcota bacterium]